MGGAGREMGNNVIAESLAGNLETFMKVPPPPHKIRTRATTLISLDDILPPWHRALKRNGGSHLGGLRHWEGVEDVP